MSLMKTPIFMDFFKNANLIILLCALNIIIDEKFYIIYFDLVEHA